MAGCRTGCRNNTYSEKPIPERAVARVLIVEDSPDNMKLFSAVLGLQGHTVAGMADGDGLLAELEAAPPDLILMDVQLPGKDGFELLSEIRRSPWGATPVVALTAHAMTGDMDRALQAGFDGYITKPIDVRAFGGQVANALNRGRGRTTDDG
jgi:CheY-like chemotaxis protein